MVIAGGFATAAWWAGDVLIETQNTEITDNQSSSSDNISGAANRENNVRAELADEEPDTQPYDDNDSPTIYQRESF